MHELLKSPDDVLAVKLSGTITGEDLDAVMDRTDEIMAAHDKIHVFCETHDIQGMQLSALPHHMGRAFPLFGKLDRFGRVAVVSDQPGCAPERGSKARCCRTSATASAS